MDLGGTSLDLGRVSLDLDALLRRARSARAATYPLGAARDAREARGGGLSSAAWLGLK
jgi:hypothetical protein